MKAGEYFDLNGKIDREEAESIIEAAFDRDKRSGNEGSTYYKNYEKAVFIENSTAQSDIVGIDSNDEHESAADLRDNCEHEGVADAENNGEFADTTDQENYCMQDRKKERIRIDIRSRAEYALGHAEDTVNIPMDELISNPYNVLQAYDDVLYTNSGLMVHDDPIRVTQQVCPNLNTPIEIISDDLSRLETTANCLKAAGFRSIRSNLTDFHDT